jgi:hypothetical protein
VHAGRGFMLEKIALANLFSGDINPLDLEQISA